MTAMDPRVRSWLIWLAPAIVIALLLGWETDWGHALKRVPEIAPIGKPQPVVTALLPEYKLDGGTDARRETVERTLFNPTRRPAPPQPQAAAGGAPAFVRGQFVLTGTTVVGDKATAFLREVNGGKPRRVQRGETVNGMLVAEVAPDRVKLTLGGDAEELTLKVASGPRATIQPQPLTPPAVPGAPSMPGAQTAAPAAQAQDVATVLAERRRAARAAEAAAAIAAGRMAAPPTPAAGAPTQAPATSATPRNDPAWNDVYQRYMQPRK